MLRNILLLLLVTLISIPSAMSANKAYKVMGETSLVDRIDGKRTKLVTLEKGDTVYATEETEAYLAEHDGGKITNLPVEFKGTRGYATFSYVYPIKITPQDTLAFIQTKQVKDRVAQERFLVPAMEWAMNVSPSHMTWIYLIFISLVCAGVFTALAGKKPLYYVGLVLAGISLCVTTFAEVMYLLCFHNYVIWFVKPSVVGGWGHVILNFIILSLVLAAQVGLFYFIWKQSFKNEIDMDEKKSSEDDEDDEDTPSWLVKMAFWPVALGVLLMVLIWVDYFEDNTMSAGAYLIAFASLGVCALCGAAYQFYNKRWLQGILFPVLYIGGGIGIACLIMILGMLVVLVAVVAVIFGLLAAGAIGAVAGLFGAGRRVTGYTDDGTKITGTQDAFGNVKGDDGNTYKIK